MKFSLLPFNQIEEIINNHRKNLGKWIVQTSLAEEMTLLVHGQEGLELANRCSHLLFNCNKIILILKDMLKFLFIGSYDELERTDFETIKELFGDASTFQIPRNSVKTLGEIAETTREGGAELMKTGAFKMNGVKRTNPCEKFTIEQISIRGKFSVICWGKRKFSLILWN